MLRAVALVILLSLGVARAQEAQAYLRVLRSNTDSIDVQEGTKLYKAYWTASPGTAKDTYYTHRFAKSTTVRFISDVDSISFKVRPGQTYDFVVLLHGKDRCLTEISTIRTTAYKAAGGTVDGDQIPFSIGKDGRIYIEGSINGSPRLRFFFDNGADNTIVFPSAFKKGLTMKFDDSVENRASGGTQSRRTANHAHLQIGDLNWNDEWAMYVEKQLGDDADGTIGYDVFEDKVVEINFDRMVMVIRDRAAVDSSYTPFKMILNGREVPSIASTLVAGNAQIERPLLFDMGATGYVSLNHQTAAENHLFDTLKAVGDGTRSGAGAGSQKTEVAIVPELRLGPYVLRDVPINLSLAGSSDDSEEVGMDVLKRFNLVLDFPGGVIYMKPDSLFGSPYRKRY
ncbi:MAG TPA: pepsin/retropepsin-like aspartic protease family protein [Acidobacteriaceae bacterium]|jgi:hypothetical protein|nr:pepsin/retropepsin-like aspartic protease family protein [Acidobacteriaceae bacterium]